MSDLFTHLAGRALSRVPVAQPLVRSRYAGPGIPEQPDAKAEGQATLTSIAGAQPSAARSARPDPGAEPIAPDSLEAAVETGEPLVTRSPVQPPTDRYPVSGPVQVETGSGPPRAARSDPTSPPAPGTPAEPLRYTEDPSPVLLVRAAETNVPPRSPLSLPVDSDVRTARGISAPDTPPAAEIPFGGVLVPEVPMDTARQTPAAPPVPIERPGPAPETRKPGGREAPTIHISIGRIEIRAAQPERRTVQQPPQHPAPEQPKTDLAAYLNKRNEGRR